MVDMEVNTKTEIVLKGLHFFCFAWNSTEQGIGENGEDELYAPNFQEMTEDDLREYLNPETVDP